MKRLGMSKIIVLYFPVKETHTASIRSNRTICLPKWSSLLDSTWRNYSAELAADLIKIHQSWISLHSIHKRGFFFDDLYLALLLNVVPSVWICGIPILYFLINLHCILSPFCSSSLSFYLSLLLKLMSSPSLSLTGYLSTISRHASHSIHTHHESLPRAVLPPSHFLSLILHSFARLNKFLLVLQLIYPCS